MSLNSEPLESAKTEPPITLSLSGPQLMALEDKPLEVGLPMTSVAVERAIKDVTAAATVSADSLERDGFIFQIRGARAKNPYQNRNRVWAV